MPIQHKKRQLWWDSERFSHHFLNYIQFFRNGTLWVSFFLKQSWSGIPSLIVFFVPIVSATVLFGLLTVVATIGLILITILSSVIAFVWMILINSFHLLLFGIYRIREYGKRWIFKKNIYLCPYCHKDIWHTNSKIPLYGCPKCREKLPLLWPNTYGILQHVCKCDTRLSTSLSERKKLDCFCPNCKDERRILIKQWGVLPPLCIGILGTSDDKTKFFMLNAIKGLEQNHCKTDLADKSKLYDLDNIERGIVSGSSDETFVWHVEAKKDSFLLYMYPQSDNLLNNPNEPYFLDNIHGLVLILNSEELSDSEAVFVKSHRYLEKVYDLVGKKLSIPLAVLWCGRQPDQSGSPREQVYKQANNLYRLIKDHFKRVQFFFYSSVKSYETNDPFLWVLQQCGYVKSIKPENYTQENHTLYDIESDKEQTASSQHSVET